MGIFDHLAQCTTCGQSDPTKHTVKVDPALLAGGKENVEPVSAISGSIEEQKEFERLRQEKELRKAQEEMLRQAEAEAAEKWRAEEQAQRQEEEAARAAAEALARREAEQGRRRLAEEQAAREAAAAEAESARLAEEARVLKEEELLRKAQAKVNAWCKANGYANVNSQKKKLLSASKFPLHEAVATKDLELVKSLVICGADKNAKNSQGQKAKDLASKSNKNHSMDDFLAALA